MTRNHKHTGVVPSRSLSPVTRTRDTSDAPLLADVLKSGATGLAAFVISGAILLFAMTAIAYANSNPDILIPPLSLVALLPSAFVGGFVCTKRVKEAPLLCGIVTGGMITFLIILLALILRGLPSSGFEFWQSAALHSASVVFSVLGSFAGNAKKKAKMGKRRFG